MPAPYSGNYKKKILSPKFSTKYLYYKHGARYLFALLMTTGLLGLTLPSGPLFWLPLAALVPFFMILRGCQPAKGYALGWAGGSLFWLVSTFWIFNGCRELMGWPVPVAFFATLIFILYQGLPYGLAGLVCGIAKKYGITAGPFFTAGIFTLFIAVWPALCPGSPAISLYKWTKAMQIADIGGMHFVLFFMLLSNALLAEILSSPSPKKIRFCAIYIFLLCLVLGYGSIRLNELKTMESVHPESRISVRTIQPNISFKTDPLNKNQLKSNHITMRQLTEESSRHLAPPNLILWPEAPSTPSCNNLDLKALEQTESLTRSPVLFACTEYTYRLKKQESLINPDGSKKLSDFPIRELSAMYNSVALLENGKIKKIYRKTRLVPFGEATPLG
ncbi:MAG: hypothetical protein EOM06_14630, partial [Sphingobacteriia bacterium]|nr:hypothetical protein [Sphingobacteriia bacterium]